MDESTLKAIHMRPFDELCDDLDSGSFGSAISLGELQETLSSSRTRIFNNGCFTRCNCFRTSIRHVIFIRSLKATRLLLGGVSIYDTTVDLIRNCTFVGNVAIQILGNHYINVRSSFFKNIHSRGLRSDVYFFYDRRAARKTYYLCFCNACTRRLSSLSRVSFEYDFFSRTRACLTFSFFISFQKYSKAEQL